MRFLVAQGSLDDYDEIARRSRSLVNVKKIVQWHQLTHDVQFLPRKSYC